MGAQVFAAGPLGGVGVASWVPRPGQHLSEAAGRQAEGRQENLKQAQQLRRPGSKGVLADRDAGTQESSSGKTQLARN